MELPPTGRGRGRTDAAGGRRPAASGCRNLAGELLAAGLSCGRPRLYGRALRSYQYAEAQTWADLPLTAAHLRLRIENRGNVVTYRYSTDDGATWIRHPTRMEVSGLNHNVFGGFLSLRPAVFCTGRGSVVLDRFTYAAGSSV